MATGTFPKPGTELGPCNDTECGHKDCATTREMAASTCEYCMQPIGYERNFYALPHSPRTVLLVHASCHDDYIEQHEEKASKIDPRLGGLKLDH